MRELKKACDGESMIDDLNDSFRVSSYLSIMEVSPFYFRRNTQAPFYIIFPVMEILFSIR